MLAAVESASIDAIVTWHNDRLHRSPKELEAFRRGAGGGRGSGRGGRARRAGQSRRRGATGHAALLAQAGGSPS
ncbi:MAG: hypothetical protein LC790_03445 [Actinobacteria bacterium]|nr:hypothetical protein [Actinomycetota bacterium]